ncbi:MAG: 4-hydroxythreonine-4-phosphate dehydrogenase, partial [Pseudomonadota bacterium]
MGEPCGIGPEIILKSWKNAQTSDAQTIFAVFGNADILRQVSEMLHLGVLVTPITSVHQAQDV